MSAIITWSDEGVGPRPLCHCWEPVFVNDAISPGFTRGLCEHCDSVRCDAYPGACGR